MLLSSPLAPENRPSLIFFTIIFACFYLMPVFSDNFYILSIFTTAYFYIIFATSWDVFAGYGHLMNFGHALFIGLAGYLTAYLDTVFHLSPILVLPLCVVLTGVAGLLIGFLTLRLKGPYFAMVTITFAAVAYESSIMFSEYTGGEEGIPGISTLTDSLTGDYYIALVAMTFIFLLLICFTRSRYGLLLKAISQNEDAVLASGINTAKIKILTYAISGALCGLGGSIYTYFLTHVGPTSLEQVFSTTILIMAIVGGIGTITGPFLGAFALVMFNELFRDFEQYRLLVYTILVVVIVFTTPKGLISYGKPLMRFSGLKKYCKE